MELKQLIAQTFELLTGSKLEGEQSIHVARLAHGGISSGYVHTAFWLKRGIPFISSRYRRALRKHAALTTEENKT